MIPENGTALPADTLYSLEPAFEVVPETKRVKLLSLARGYHDLEKDFVKEQFYSRQKYNLLSTRWLARWKVFVGYNSATSAVPIDKYFGCGQLPRQNEDIVDWQWFKEQPANPKQAKLRLCFIEPGLTKYNAKLRPGLQEGLEYVFISEEMQHLLEQGQDYYQPLTLFRTVQTTPEGKRVQLYYQQLNVLCMYPSYCKDIEMGKTKTFIEVQMQFSRYRTLKDFVTKTKEYMVGFVKSKRAVQFPTQEPLRLWALPVDLTREQCLKSLKEGCTANSNYNYKLFMNWELLEENKCFYEYDVLDRSLVVCELQEVKHSWIFYNSTVTMVSTCSECCLTKELKFFCSCKFAAYCSKFCKTKNKYAHQGRCPKNAESDDQVGETKMTPYSKRGVAGLINLGNTCYMNSGLQCIAHIKEIVDYFLNNKHLPEINMVNPLGTKGELASNFGKFVQQLYFGNSSCCNPAALKRAISRFAPMFSGYMQHDAGELINYLLDGLHEDLNRVYDKPYVQTVKHNNREDLVVAAEAWQAHLLRNRSIVVDLMHGQFRSVVDCPECNYKSIQFDPFLVCSLPIVSITKKSIRLIFVKNHVQEIVLHLSSTINSHTCMSEIEKMAIVKLGLAGHVRLFFYVLSYGNCEVIHSTDLVEKVMLRYKGSNIYLRELMAHEDPQKDVKVILQNTICESEFGEKYRINIIPRRIYFFSNDTTTKQLHYRLYSYYKQHYEVGNYEQDIINVSAQEQPLRIMGLPSSYSDICKSCCQKNCQGCIFRFDDTKLGQFLQDKVELEIFWRMNAREIKERMQSQQGEQVGSGNTTKPKGTTIEECLSLFEQAQILNEENTWHCEMCKKFVQAKKQMQIYKVPTILLLCLKRFKRSKYHLEKYNIFVDFPIEALDLTKYVLNHDLPGEDKPSDGEHKPLLYDLIGVSNHFGSTGGGHYTAYCKDPYSNEWYDFDDSSADRIKRSQVVTEGGYILFYRRRN